MNEGSTHIGHVAPLHGTGGAEARYNPFIWNNSATIAQQQYQVGLNNPTYAIPVGPMSMNMTNVADYGTPVDNDATAQANAPADCRCRVTSPGQLTSVEWVACDVEKEGLQL